MNEQSIAQDPLIEELKELYRIALIYSRSPARAKILVEKWYQGQLQSRHNLKQ